MPDWLIDLLLAHRYWIIVPLAFMEGPIVTFAVGSLAALGYFHLWIVYPILVSVDFVPDMIYYKLGSTRYSKKIVARFERLHMHLKAIEHLWFDHTFKMMMISKWAYGLSIPLMVSAGLAKLPVRRYMAVTLPISMIQYGLFLLLGYFFGASASSIGDSLSFIQMLIGAAIVVFLILYVTGKVVRRQFEKIEQREEQNLG